jgi:hypothetical protein
MRIAEIPRDAWSAVLDEFTRAHEGWLVTLDVLGPEFGAQHEIENLPLVGISADRADQDRSIAVSVERGPDAHLTHIVQAVDRLFLQRSDEGADFALLIQGADEVKTILRFRSAVPPETVDGALRR